MVFSGGKNHLKKHAEKDHRPTKFPIVVKDETEKENTMQWTLTVVEQDDHYIYHFDSWAEVLVRLAKFDGLSVEYSITHSQKRTLQSK